MGKINDALKNIQETNMILGISTGSNIYVDAVNNDTVPVTEAEDDYNAVSVNIVRLFYGNYKNSMEYLTKLLAKKSRISVSKEVVDNPSQYNKNFVDFQNELIDLLKKYTVMTPDTGKK